MKKIFYLLCLLSLKSSAQTPNEPDSVTQLHSRIQAIMDSFTRKGVPGSSIAIYSQGSIWQATSGYARLEDSVRMRPTDLHYLQSVSKTYIAVGILKLKEENRIDLDADFRTYLSPKYARYLTHPERITVRMLLHHTSGIPEYSTDPQFVSFVVQHPLQTFGAEQQLKAISGEPLIFAPGTSYAYTNTNYLLLALILDQITGDHVRFLQKVIFKPLNLTETFYRESRNYLDKKNVVDSYWDVLDTGVPANITAFQKANVSSMIGDDGIICSTSDAVKFVNGLMTGKLLKPATLTEMQTWAKDAAGNNRYGMGIAYYQFNHHIAYGHGGGGVGAGCLLVYVPDQDISIFLAVNLNVLMHSSLTAEVEKMKDEIFETILK